MIDFLDTGRTKLETTLGEKSVERSHEKLPTGAFLCRKIALHSSKAVLFFEDNAFAHKSHVFVQTIYDLLITRAL